jgi:hypothetical protein
MPLSSSLRLFGLELLGIDASTDEAAEDEGCSLDGGTTASTPISFTPSDGRWNPGADFGAGEPED